VNTYLETSAVLSWILEEPEGRNVERCLKPARVLATSELTLAECQRALRRLSALPNSPAQRRLDAFQLRWEHVPVQNKLLLQVGQAFPVEPVRTLDAIHLVTALALRPALPGLTVVSLDRRVRENAAVLGFRVLP